MLSGFSLLRAFGLFFVNLVLKVSWRSVERFSGSERWVIVMFGPMTERSPFGMVCLYMGRGAVSFCRLPSCNHLKNLF